MGRGLRLSSNHIAQLTGAREAQATAKASSLRLLISSAKTTRHPLSFGQMLRHLLTPL